MNNKLSPRVAIGLLVITVVAWGINWTVTKAIVAHVPPLWTASIRMAIATAALLGMQAMFRQFVAPSRQDLRVVLVIGFFHMVAFSGLMTIGLQYVPVGRSTVLGYTTPLMEWSGRAPAPPAF